MDKKELRKIIKAKVSEIAPETRALLSENVALSIEKTDEWIKAKSVLLFCSLPDELEMNYLITDALDSGKKVVLPVVNGDSLDLFYYDPLKMRKGTFGILEPTSDSALAQEKDIDLAVIPGRAFTVEGKRLGRGKGYYDRLLPNLNCPKFGICYPCQIVVDLPVEEWDIPMDKVFYE